MLVKATQRSSHEAEQNLAGGTFKALLTYPCQLCVHSDNAQALQRDKPQPDIRDT